MSILEDKIQYVSDGSNCAMKVPHSLFVLILLSCLTPFYFYSPRDFLNSVPEGRDLQLHDLWVCAIWNETRMTSWRPFQDWKPISSSGKPPQTKVKKYFLGRKSSSITFVKSVSTHFLTNWSILLIRHRQNRDSGFFFSQLCKNEKRKTKKRCLTVFIRSKIRLWVSLKQHNKFFWIHEKWKSSGNKTKLA